MTELTSHTDLLPKVFPLTLFLDQSWIWKSKQGLEIANPSTLMASQFKSHSMHFHTP